MDYAKQLQGEVQGSHAAFHEFALSLERLPKDALFFFFEGDEDPSFYIGHARPTLKDRRYSCFVCNGRTEVLKAHQLVQNDGRATARSLFFVDKDHHNICEPKRVALPQSIFETSHYSIENYIPCEEVLRNYWVERLHLSNEDDRLDANILLLQKLHADFCKRSRLLMAAVLIGRGVTGLKDVKLNLNNVQLDKVIKIEVTQQRCRYAPGAMRNFLASSNMTAAGIKVSAKELRSVYRQHISGRAPKDYLRGKYELWFFCKFLSFITRQLSDRAVTLKPGQRRATPNNQLTYAGCLESLAPLTPQPPELAAFFASKI